VAGSRRHFPLWRLSIICPPSLRFVQMAVPGGRMPPYQLLPYTVAVERTFPDIAENEMEVEIAQSLLCCAELQWERA